MLASLILACLACAPTTTVIGGNGDTGSNEDSGSNLDSAGDSGADSGADSGGDTGTDPTPADYAGEYRGENEGRWDGGDWQADCAGDVRFTVAESGALEGSADCAFEGNGENWAFEGEVVGEVDADGLVTLTWLVDFGREAVEVVGEGQITGGDAFVELLVDLGRSGDYSGEMNAQRR